MCLVGLGLSSWFHWQENRLPFALRENCTEPGCQLHGRNGGPSQGHYSSDQLVLP